MYELRFILLGIGVVGIIALWWWERRRARITHDYRDPRPSERHEPSLIDSDPNRTSGDLDFGFGEHDDEHEHAPIVATRNHDQRVDPGLPPPVITIDDLPDDVDSVELVTPDRSFDHPAPVHVAPDASWAAAGDLRPTAAPGRTAIPRPAAPAEAAPPPEKPRVREPERGRGELQPEVGAAAARTADEPAERKAAPSGEQRIVAMRMAAGRIPVNGRALLAALETENLAYGRYSIFHRQRADGRLLFSVASLSEPGSFDIEEMPKQSFPGVSLFAVFPGPDDAPQVFDDMLATARRLADRLGGSLQDERGIALSAQRILTLREELVHFQDFHDQIRNRGAG